MKTLEFKFTKPYMLFYHTREKASNEEWNKALAYYKEIIDGSSDIEKFFIFSDGGAPDALQRRKLVELFEGREQPPLYLFTKNKFVQRVGKMLSFLGINKIFIMNSDDVEEELQSIGLDSYQAKRITTVVELLKERLESDNRLYN